MDKYKVQIELTEEMLGTVPNKLDYKGYITPRGEEDGVSEELLAEELETVPENTERGRTVFREVDGKPALVDYMIKGFFKEACGSLRRVPGTQSKKLTAYKKVINGLVFVSPRYIPLVLPEGGEMGTNIRPLRASTPKGDRVALACSDTVPAGTTCEFEVKVLGVVTEATLREWLDHGELSGLGSWRGGGHGTFTYEMTKIG